MSRLLLTTPACTLAVKRFLSCVIISLNLLVMQVWGGEGAIKTAAALDQVIISNITISYTSEHHFPGNRMIPASTSKRSVEFTRSKEKIANISDVILDDHSLPIFIPNGSNTISNDEKSPLGQHGREVIFAGSKKNYMKDYILGWDEKKKTWIGKESDVSSLIVDADSKTLSGSIDMPLWMIGRGIVTKIIEVVSCDEKVNKENEKIIRVHGKESNEKEWQIDILPDKSYMIRKAIRYRSGHLDLTISTYGSQEYEGLIYPEMTIMEVSLGSRNAVTKCEISSIQSVFNETLYNEAKKDIEKELPRGAFVKDESSGQDRSYIQGFEEHSQSNIPIVRQQTHTTLIIVTIIINIIVFILLFYIFYNRNK